MPAEIVEAVAALLDPRDVAALSVTCSSMAWTAGLARAARFGRLRAAYAALLGDIAELVKRTALMARDDDGPEYTAMEVRGACTWTGSFSRYSQVLGTAGWDLDGPMIDELGDPGVLISMDTAKRTRRGVDTDFYFESQDGQTESAVLRVTERAHVASDEADEPGDDDDDFENDYIAHLMYDELAPFVDADAPKADYAVRSVNVYFMHLVDDESKVSLAMNVDPGVNARCKQDRDNVLAEGPAAARLRGEALRDAWIGTEGQSVLDAAARL